jgi:hypothetical protein
MPLANTRSVTDPPSYNGILIVRVWSQHCDGPPRIRLTRVAHGRELPVVTVTSVEEALIVAQLWLEELVEHRRGGEHRGNR